MEYKCNDYRSLYHEEWCDLMSTMEAKDDIKRDAVQIKILAASKSAPDNSDSDTSEKVTG